MLAQVRHKGYLFDSSNDRGGEWNKQKWKAVRLKIFKGLDDDDLNKEYVEEGPNLEGEMKNPVLDTEF